MDLSCEVTCEDRLLDTRPAAQAKPCNRRCYQRCQCSPGHLTLRGFCVSEEECGRLQSAVSPLRKQQVFDDILRPFSALDRLPGTTDHTTNPATPPPVPPTGGAVSQGNLLQQLENIMRPGGQQTNNQIQQQQQPGGGGAAGPGEGLLGAVEAVLEGGEERGVSMGVTIGKGAGGKKEGGEGKDSRGLHMTIEIDAKGGSKAQELGGEEQQP